MTTAQEVPSVEHASDAHTIQRRTLLRGAAWSVPVVAAASVVPQAAASGAEDATLTSPNLSILIGNPATGEFRGTLVGPITILNVSGRWQTGLLQSRLSLEGIAGASMSLSKVQWVNGSLSGTSLLESDTTFTNTIDGIEWTISVLHRADGGLSIVSSAPSQVATVQFETPSISYQGAARRPPVSTHSFALTTQARAAALNGGVSTFASYQYWTDSSNDW